MVQVMRYPVVLQDYVLRNMNDMAYSSFLKIQKFLNV